MLAISLAISFILCVFNKENIVRYNEITLVLKYAISTDIPVVDRNEPDHWKFCKTNLIELCTTFAC